MKVFKEIIIRSLNYRTQYRMRVKDKEDVFMIMLGHLNIIVLAYSLIDLDTSEDKIVTLKFSELCCM